MNKIENLQPDKADIKRVLGKKLTDLMTAKDCNQTDVAEGTGIYQSKVSNMVNSKALPNSAELIALANYFDVSVDELLGRGKKGKTDISTYGIAQILADWLSVGRISIEEVAIAELAPPNYDDGPEPEPYEYTNREIKYPAVIFPVYRDSDFDYKNNYLNERFISGLKKLDGAREVISQDDLEALLEKRLQSLKDDLDKNNPHLK